MDPNRKGVPAANRLPHLDSIRGLAAISVALFHCIWHIVLVHRYGTPEKVASVVLSVLDLGKFGVVLFFAISGYVIPFSLSLSGKRPVRTFLASRFFRLYPAYWVSMLLGATFLWKWTVTWPIMAANTTMLQRFFGKPDILGVYWTLQIELIFYAICATLLSRGIVRSRVATVAGFGVGLAIALVFAILRGRGVFHAPIAIPLSLAVMFWGDLNRTTERGRWRSLRNITTLVLLVGILPICLIGYDSAETPHEGLRYVITYAVGLMLFRIWSDRPNWHNSVLDKLGKISFSIYLMHPVAMGIDRIVPNSLNPWITTAVVMSITILGATLCYRFVEIPAIELGKRVRSRLAA